MCTFDSERINVVMPEEINVLAVITYAGMIDAHEIVVEAFHAEVLTDR